MSKGDGRLRHLGVILVLGLVHLAIVVLAASENGGEGTAPILLFADEFDPSKDQLGVMTQLFAFRNFCAEEWPHVLIWDLFVGRAIWLDGLSRGIVTWHSAVLLTNLIGPPGLVLHALTCCSPATRCRSPSAAACPRRSE